MAAEHELRIATPGQYLSFILDSQPYAVQIATVREINRMSDITPVPGTPPFMAGVMNLRGKVIPVVNLRMKFDIPRIEVTRDTCIIVVETPLGQIGMIVDSVSGVLDLDAKQIEPPPKLGQNASTAFLIGMGKLDRQVVVLIDIVRALSQEELSAVTSARAA